ncbi:circularly permuted type 2 ATP-grasp protein [Nocardioides sp. Kera G14]|uniref:circularly permuted type 2 ATP-grasp protein n=1 Tax=Nocardioides sp. Kera G14 TaxID=2884264 RepID=UPI001D104DC0|nr:circularly permuted type 2 ATP-grasp protein [Nocardioides sp. Kera G14]UDY24630.1 circularly permuted type 2 ATP-grasp protein [Nocardioides sp. Kera G14]
MKRWGDYDTGEAYDEVFAAPGEVREVYAETMARLERTDLDKLSRTVNEQLAADGVVFGGEEAHAYQVDPIPRLLTEDEWNLLARGVSQRAEVLNALVADAYGERRAVNEGVLPARVLDETPYFEKDLAGWPEPPDGWVTVIGFDLVRDRDGRFRVLEDNLRTPAGLAYADAANSVVADVTDLGPQTDSPSFLQAGADALRRALESSAPDVDGELLLITDGELNSAWYEHQRIAEAAGLRIALVNDLRRRGDRVELSDGTPVRAFYRRSDDDSIRDENGVMTPLAEIVLDPLRAGRVGMVNRFGGGVGDDKMLYAYVDDLTRFYLGEDPLLPSVRTYDLLNEAKLADASERLHELVVKPRDGYGGHGVVVGPAASEEEIEEARKAIHDDPHAWIAQDVIELSTLPVIVDGRLEPRHVDLRVVAVRDADGVTALRGGLTRVALEAGSMVVNSSRDGGAKPTWVVPGRG